MTVPRGFDVTLPEGFVHLPVDGDADADLVATFARLFSLDPDSDYARATAAAYTEMGLVLGQELDSLSVGLYRSPDDPTRPVMITVAARTMPSDHENVRSAIEGLLEIHHAQGRGDAEHYKLPVGPAVTLVVQDDQEVAYDGVAVPVTSREVSLWVPDPDGTTLGVVAVQTNSWRDWERVCVLAVDVFDSFAWHPPKPAVMTR